MPKAYLVVEHIVIDAAKFKEYLTKVGPTIAKHGGRALTKGNAHNSRKEGIGSQSWSSSPNSPT